MSKGSRVTPEIASEGIHEIEVTDEATRMPPMIARAAGPHPVETAAVCTLLGDLAAGRTSAVEAVTDALDALHRVDASTGAVAWFDDERARRDAARVDAAFRSGGPLAP